MQPTRTLVSPPLLGGHGDRRLPAQPPGLGCAEDSRVPLGTPAPHSAVSLGLRDRVSQDPWEHVPPLCWLRGLLCREALVTPKPRLWAPPFRSSQRPMRQEGSLRPHHR